MVDPLPLPVAVALDEAVSVRRHEPCCRRALDRRIGGHRGASSAPLVGHYGQVFIEFPAGFARDQAPPLFARGSDGTSELINYRVRGRFYVVDRLFDAAELRLGGRKQQVVRIERREGKGR
jgi:hypothetical protein